MPRMLDLWIDANAITLLATTVSMTLTWRWHQANRAAAARETGPVLGVLRLNMLLARLWLALNAAVFLLGLYLIEVARGIDRAASAAHPARIPSYVVSGTVAFTCIWVFACWGAWTLRRGLDRIAASEETTPQLRVVDAPQRRTGGD